MPCARGEVDLASFKIEPVTAGLVIKTDYDSARREIGRVVSVVFDDGGDLKVPI